MGQNEQDIWLLNNNPGELISSCQDLIKLIVAKYKRLGFVTARESEDLVQDVNRKLLERIGKIQNQYNGKSQLRTYLSVIIRNICREEFRKNPKVEEPQPPEYHLLERAETPFDNFLIKQEYYRLEKVFRLFFNDRPRLILMLRYIMDLKISSGLILDLFPNFDNEIVGSVSAILVNSDEMTKKEKYIKLSEALNELEGNHTSPDSLRKWFVSRYNDCLVRMNGNPPRSGYDLESLTILIEKYESLKK